MFYDGVIVTESANDSVFYAEIYNKVKKFRSVPHILFLNAQNKQTIRDIVGALRRCSVPAVALPDIDIIKDGGRDWTKWLEAVNIPSATHISLGQLRSEINNLFETQNLNMKARHVVENMKIQDKTTLSMLLKTLSDFGLFVNPAGELECWLPKLGISGKKQIGHLMQLANWIS